MTIDTLLADVSPLLPLYREKAITGHTTVRCQQGPLAFLVESERLSLTEYSIHAANHFPAMLQALREIAEFYKHNKSHECNTTVLQNIAKQALAAASEVTQ